MTADDDKRRHTVKMAPPSSRAQREAADEDEELDPDGPTQLRQPRGAAVSKATRRLQGQLLAGLVCTEDPDLGAFRRLRLGLDAAIDEGQLAALREHLRLAALALRDPEAPFWRRLEAFAEPVTDEATPPADSRTDPQLKTDPFLRLPRPSPPHRSSSVPPSSEGRSQTRPPGDATDGSPSTERTPTAGPVEEPHHGYGYGPAPVHTYNPSATMAMTPAGGAPAVSSRTPLGGVPSTHGGIPVSAPAPNHGVPPQESPPSVGGEEDPWVRPWGQAYAAPDASPVVETATSGPAPAHDGYPGLGQDPSFDGIPSFRDGDPSYDAIAPLSERDPSYEGIAPPPAPPAAAPPPGAPPPGAPPPDGGGYPPPARRTNPGIAPPRDAYPTASPSEPTYPHRSSHPEPSPPPAAVQPEPEPVRLDPLVSHAHGLALSVEEYAALCAERDYQGPHAHEATQARYDVHSSAAWEATRQAFALRFSRDPSLRHQWEQAYYRFTAYLRARR